MSITAATEDGQLVELALRMALATRHLPAGLLHHSERGSERYQALLREADFEVSMSRTVFLIRVIESIYPLDSAFN